MPLPVVSQEQLERVHQALRITVPLESLSPVMLATITHIAHCWGDRIPANLWPEHADDLSERRMAVFEREYMLTPYRHNHDPEFIDNKRRAAGDND